MSKILGSLLIVGGATALGLIKSCAIQRRIKGLEGMILSLELIRGEICTCLTPLPEIVEKLAREQPPPISEFFIRLGKRIERLGEESFSEMWVASLRKCTEMGLEKEELSTLCAVGACLGRFDVKEQENTINQCVTRLSGILKRAREEGSTQCKLWTGLGVSGGLIITIILI